MTTTNYLLNSAHNYLASKGYKAAWYYPCGKPITNTAVLDKTKTKLYIKTEKHDNIMLLVLYDIKKKSFTLSTIICSNEGLQVINTKHNGLNDLYAMIDSRGSI